MAGGISRKGTWECEFSSIKGFVSRVHEKADVCVSFIDRITTIREDLLPGQHTLTCEVLSDTLDPKGGTEFRLISVLSD
jgi:hypothetical protein